MPPFDSLKSGSPRETPYTIAPETAGIAAVEDDPETQWLARAAAKTLKQIESGENLAADLEDLVTKFEQSGDAERLISESAGIVAIVGLHHVREGHLRARDVLEATPGLVTATAAVKSEGPFSENLAEAAEKFCVDFTGPESPEQVERARTAPLAPEKSRLNPIAGVVNDPTLTPMQKKLFEANWPRVERVAKSILRSWRIHPDELEEVILDGNLGLVKAIKKGFDLNKAAGSVTTHGTYIITSIRGEILHGMRDRYGRALVGMKDEEGNDIPEGKILKVKPSAMKAINTADSFDQQTTDEGGATLGEITSDPRDTDEVAGKVIDKIMIDTELKRLLANADSRDREIFLRGVLLDQTQSAISEVFGISQMQVSRIIRGIQAGNYRSRPTGRPKKLPGAGDT